MDSDEWVPAPEVVELQVEPPKPRRRMGTGTLVVAFIALASLISAVAIAASGASHPSVAAMLSAAPATTRDAGSASMTSTVTLTVAGTTRNFETIDAVSNFRTGDSDVHMTVESVSTEILNVHHVEYVSGAGIPLPNGASWLSITRADLGNPAAVGLDGAGGNSAGLDYLAGKALNTATIGHATVNGVATTHYKFTLDLAPLTKAIGKASSKLGSPQLAAGLRQLSNLTDLTKVPAQAWLDSAHRVRRLDIVLKLSAQGQTVSEDSVMNFTDFGAPVSLSAPPADEVVPLSQVPDAFNPLADSSNLTT